MARTYPGGEHELDTGWGVKQGIIGGVIAGITFVLAEMIGSAVVAGNPFIMPLKAMASVPIGTPPPEIPTGTAIPVGLIFHMLLSIVLGIIFALIVTNVAALRSSPTVLVIAASVYGIIVWLVNFYILAPLIGRPWFTEIPPVPQFVYHTFFFGTVLGLYLAWALPRPRTA
jgi:uncharacterized membrane protein YagU involved in acid resistance